MKRGAVMGADLAGKVLSPPSKWLLKSGSALGLIGLTGSGSWTGPAERVHHGGWRGMLPSDRTLAQPPLARVPLGSVPLDGSDLSEWPTCPGPPSPPRLMAN